MWKCEINEESDALGCSTTIKLGLCHLLVRFVLYFGKMQSGLAYLNIFVGFVPIVRQ